MSIFGFDKDFCFDELSLGTPISKSKASQSYLMRIKRHDGPLYIQPPISESKQGIQRSGKQMYCDLLFAMDEERFMKWVEGVEKKMVDLIYDRRKDWFESELDREEIESYLQSLGKTVQGGKKFLVRAGIPCTLGRCDLKIYDNAENEVSVEEIKEHTSIYTILEVKGIRCSVKSFQFELEIKQMMIAEPQRLFEKCILSTSKEETKKEVLETKDAIVAKDEEQKQKPEQEQEQEQEQKQAQLPVVKKKESLEISLNDWIEAKDQEEEEEVVALKPRDDLYYQMYKAAKRKAQEAKWIALTSYLEAQNIKEKYLGNAVISDDDEEEDGGEKEKI